MSIAYFDCFSGISGDMVLGALVDAGLPLVYLRRELKKLGINGYKVTPSPLAKSRAPRQALDTAKSREGEGRGEGGTIAGTNLHINIFREANFHHYSDIKRLIEKSRLTKKIKELALKIFLNLARAEAKVHGRKVLDVHFHEIGGLDSIIDIVGTAIGVHYFNFKTIYSSPLPVTRGFVKCAHGRLPVPPPAVMELLKGIPIEPTDIKGEIVTPTGAAIIKTLAKGFGALKLRRIDHVGYGFGDRKIPGTINALRLLIGEGQPPRLSSPRVPSEALAKGERRGSREIK